jgi:hypothetical protein
MPTKNEQQQKYKKQMKKTAGKKVIPMKKTIKKRKPTKKREIPKKQMAKKQAAPKKLGMKSLDTVVLPPEELGSRPPSGKLSGDLQGLANIEDADTESVAELVEEGNAFEADFVKGVEDAWNADEGPVRTHEVPEDDVTDDEIPDEYKHKE